MSSCVAIGGVGSIVGTMFGTVGGGTVVGGAVSGTVVAGSVVVAATVVVVAAAVVVIVDEVLVVGASVVATVVVVVLVVDEVGVGVMTGRCAPDPSEAHPARASVAMRQQTGRSSMVGTYRSALRQQRFYLRLSGWGDGRRPLALADVETGSNVTSRVLLVTGGHPFDREPLLDVFASMHGVDVEHIQQPAALDRLRPEHLHGDHPVDAIVFYDMPGITFTREDPPVEFTPPRPRYLDGLREMVEAGVGLVFMHHAIASWPATEEFAELVGGRFHYQPGRLRDVGYPDSGYAFDVTHTVEVLAPDHPICRDVPRRFEITDELYLFPVLEDDVTPIMRTGHEMTDVHFNSADRAIRRTKEAAASGWSHPPGSALVAWTKTVGSGEIVYLQFGDGPQTYADPTFRKILHNAITWSSTPRT